MFTISLTLMQQCIDMVAKGQDYIYPADGIDENYSVVNWGADGVWIVCNLDDTKIQEIILSAPKRAVVCSVVMHEVKRNY